MRYSLQPLNDEVGTPSHTTVAITHSNKTANVAQSIGRELGVVQKTLNSLLVWREGVVQHMSENKQDMATMNTKLDLLSEVILPSGVKPVVEMDNCEP